MKNNISIKIGFVSLITLALIYFGLNFLKGVNIMKNGRNFYSYYDDVSGLAVGNAVMLKGFKVGAVTTITFQPEKMNHLKVDYTINNPIEIPLNSIAKIVSLDLMGTKGINIILGDSSVKVNPGGNLKSDIEVSLQEEVNAQILPLKNKTEGLIGSIDSLMTVVTAVLNKDARDNLSMSLKSLDETFSTMSKTMKIIDNMIRSNQDNFNNTMENFSEISTDLKNNNEKVVNILQNFSSISDTLSKIDINSTVENIDNITKKINSGDGSLSQIINDKDLYQNLKKATKELEELLQDIKINPERYLNISLISPPKKIFNKE